MKRVDATVVTEVKVKLVGIKAFTVAVEVNVTIEVGETVDVSEMVVVLEYTGKLNATTSDVKVLVVVVLLSVAVEVKLTVLMTGTM